METAKSLITFAVEVGLVVAAYFMGYNGGQVSVLEGVSLVRAYLPQI